MLTGLPVLLSASLLFSCAVYWMVGFSARASDFLFFYLIVALVSIATSSLYRCVTWATRTAELANQTAPGIIGMMFVGAGYLVLYDSIPHWMLWLFWLSPLSWALRSLAQNEFGSPRYAFPSTIPHYAGVSQGEAYLRAWDIEPSGAYKWSAVAYLILAYVLLSWVSTVILARTRWQTAGGSHTKQAQSDSARSARARPVKEHSVTVLSSTPQSQCAPLHITPIVLSWRDVRYIVTLRDESGKQDVQRELLAGVSGYVKAGSLTALMGASGAGKVRTRTAELPRPCLYLFPCIVSGLSLHSARSHSSGPH